MALITKSSSKRAAAEQRIGMTLSRYWELCAEIGTTQGRAAIQLGVTRQTVNAWIHADGWQCGFAWQRRATD
jgi:hypothetical protein